MLQRLRRLLAALCLLAAFYPQTRASADVLTDARAHYEKGTRAYELGAFDEAIREYAEAYRLRDDPAILYNLGQAHRLARHIKEALFFYRMYLSKDPSASNRADVQSKIDALEEQFPSAPSEPPPKVATPPSTAVVAAPTPPPPVPEKRNGRTLTIAGIVVGGVGVIALASGAALSGLAAKAKNSLMQANQNGQPFNRSQYNTGYAESIAGPTLLAVGGAALVAGTVVAVIGVRATRAQRRATLTPWLARDGAGLALTASIP